METYNLLPTETVCVCVLSRPTECVLIDIIVTISIAIGTGCNFPHVGTECNFPHGEVDTKSHHLKTS